MNASPPSSGRTPLAGIRVLDFTHVFAGPFCTRNLADLGADVVHVETRSRGEPGVGRSAYAHRNKRSLALNLKVPSGHAVAERLARVADVIVENFSAGVMQRLGLDYDVLSPHNPRLCFVSLSGYGHSGPRRSWTSMNMNLQANTGLMMATGAEGDLPTAISSSWNDYIGGLHGAIAVLHALRERRQTGRGRRIDLSQFECSVATLGGLLLTAGVNGTAPRRLGNRSTACAPQGVYPCAGDDQWCAISIQTNEQWRALARVIQQPQWIDHNHLATAIGRLRHHDEIDHLISEWTRLLDPTEVESRLQQAGIPCERMRRAQEVAEDSQASPVYRSIPGVTGKAVLAATLPFTLDNSALCAPSSPHRLGADTAEVLHDWLALSQSEIDQLDQQGVLV